MSEEGMIQVSAAQWAKYQANEAKQKLSARRATAKSLIFVEKAKAAGIVVTKAEIDAKIAAEDALKVTEAAPAEEAA